MKTARLSLWVSMAGEDHAQGQKSRPCLCEYNVNSIGSKSLYSITSIKDARTGEEYDLEGTLSLNGNLDEAICAADPKQVAFAKRELHTDLKKPIKKKLIKKPIVQSTETNDLLAGL